MHTLQKKMSFIAKIFPKFLTGKKVVSWMLELSCFRTPFWSQRVHGCRTLLKCAGRKFCSCFALIWEISSTETSVLFRSEILGRCFNSLTGDHMYSHLIREIFPQLVWTKLCQKPKTFSAIFIPFFKYTSNLEHFEKKDELHSWNISEFLDHE